MTQFDLKFDQIYHCSRNDYGHATLFHFHFFDRFLLVMWNIWYGVLNMISSGMNVSLKCSFPVKCYNFFIRDRQNDTFFLINQPQSKDKKDHGKQSMQQNVWNLICFRFIFLLNLNISRHFSSCQSIFCRECDETTSANPKISTDFFQTGIKGILEKFLVGQNRIEMKIVAHLPRTFI